MSLSFFCCFFLKIKRQKIKWHNYSCNYKNISQKILTVFLMLAYTFIFVLNTVCPCKPYIPTPSLRGNKLFQIYVLEKEMRNFCVKRAGEKGGVGRMGRGSYIWNKRDWRYSVFSVVWFGLKGLLSQLQNWCCSGLLKCNCR